MWTLEEEQIIKENHGKKTLSQISKLLPSIHGYSSLRAKAQSMGLYRDKTKVKLPTSATHDVEYWKEPTLLNCYLAGLIAGDGCILVNQWNTTVFSYHISIKDESILDTFVKELQFLGKRVYSTCKSPHSDNISKMCRIQVGCFEQNAAYLKKHFNIVPQKTKRLAPTNLTDPLLNWAFIIGLIDSDGSVELVEKGKYGKHVYLGVNSSSRAIIEWVKTMVDTYFPECLRPANVRHHKGDNYYRFYIGGKRAIQVFSYLRQLPVPKLARKWENPAILAKISEYKEKYPDLFAPAIPLLAESV